MLDVITENIDVWSSAQTPKTSVGRGRSKNSEHTAYGINKLRELILELAVLGKLVPQYISDNSIDSLLEEIYKKKVELKEVNKIRSTKAIPDVDKNEQPIELPNNWRCVRLGNICLIRGGKRVPRGYALLETPTPHIYIRVTDMKNGTVNDSDLRYIDKDIYKQIKRYVISKEDVYITIAGTIGAVGVIPEKFDGANLTENAAKLVFRGFEKEYLVIALQSGFLQKQFLKEVNQMAQPKLALKRIETSLLPIPPIEEQHRIVAKVDELMSLCDQLEQQQTDSNAAHQTLVETLLGTLIESADNKELQENWSRIENHFDTLFTTEHSIDQLKQDILQLAVMGKLVPQNPDDEPASVLLEKIAKEKEMLIKEGKIKKQKLLSKFDNNNKPFVLPNGWLWTRFATIIQELKYGTSKRCDYKIDGDPVLRIPNVVKGYIDSNDLKFTVLDEKEKEELSLVEGDLLIIRSNGSLSIVGRSTVVDGLHEGFMYAGYLIRARLNTDLYNPAFLKLMFDSKLIRKQIEQPIRTTSGVKNVNSTEIGSLMMPSVPIDEQHRIVTKVDELMTLCDNLKAKINGTQTTQTHLADTIVERALS